MPYEKYKFELKPLPYAYNALEPYIDEETVRIHHDKHLKAYVDNLNGILEKYEIYWNWPLKKLLKYNCFLPLSIQKSVRNNAGGIYNHNFYFDIMKENLNDSFNMPKGKLLDDIIKTFDSFENFKQEFKTVGLNTFGSGYAWLVKDLFSNLKIVSTANQDVPFLYGMRHILLVDVWEHAYYLRYQNRRGDYIDNWFNIIDWEKCENIYVSFDKKNNQAI